ncbi:Ig-like domain-containing protein, partial [Aldersonia kunmingensis]|uniref:Ig-like domain-containing protein n=1 Tax=Aldersonia kunmingensis TaxID=408066 RepID=UPI000B014F1F
AQSVPLSATVAPADAVGTVQFFDNGVAIGAPVSVTGGVATVSHVFTEGAHSVTAEFSGGTGFLGSTSAVKAINVTDPEDPGTGGNPIFGSSN